MPPSVPMIDVRDEELAGGHDDIEDAVILGEVYPKNHVVGTLPPLIPVPDPDSLQWDSNVALTGTDMGFNGTLERRHSGWEAVEKEWIQSELAREQEASSEQQQHQQQKKLKIKT